MPLSARDAHPASKGIGFKSYTAHAVPLIFSALLLLLVFPWPGWGTLAYIALVPLGVVAVRSQRPWRMLFVGWVVFTVWWLLRIAWVTPVTVGGYVALCIFMALHWALVPVLCRWLVARWRWPMVFVLPLAWVTLDVWRDNLPFGGFSWFFLAHTQADHTIAGGAPLVAQTADLFGQHTVGWIVAMVNGLIVDLLTRPVKGPARGGGRRFRLDTRGGVILTACVLIGSVGYGYFRTAQTRSLPQGVALPVAVVQTNVPQSNKVGFSPAQAELDWQAMLHLTTKAAVADPKPAVIVWPETMVYGALNDEAMPIYRNNYPGWSNGARFHDETAAMAARLQTHLLVGAHAYDNWGEITLESGLKFPMPNLSHNSAYLFGPDGKRAAERYDKRHLVPFGEYIPMSITFPWVKTLVFKVFNPYGYDYTVTPGARRDLFPVEHEGHTYRIAAPICYEDVVSRATRTLVYQDGRKQADVIVNQTNSAWYTGPSQREQHVQIATLRCIENRVPMARSVNTGISAFIDSQGRIVDAAAENGDTQRVAAVASYAMQRDPRVTLYGRVGDTPVRLLAAFTIAMCILGRFRRARR